MSDKITIMFGDTQREEAIFDLLQSLTRSKSQFVQTAIEEYLVNRGYKLSCLTSRQMREIKKGIQESLVSSSSPKKKPTPKKKVEAPKQEVVEEPDELKEFESTSEPEEVFVQPAVGTKNDDYLGEKNEGQEQAKVTVLPKQEEPPAQEKGNVSDKYDGVEAEDIDDDMFASMQSLYSKSQEGGSIA